MPIAPCFDPTTGASGGAKSSGSADPGMRSLGNLNGGTYSFSDPSGGLLSYSYDSATDLHSFTVPTIAVADQKWSFLSGLDFLSAKWHKLLTYGDGTPVLAGDAFSLNAMFTDYTPGGCNSWVLGVAVVQQPTSSALAFLQSGGVYQGCTAVGTPLIGGHIVNAGVSGAVPSMTFAAGSVLYSGAPSKLFGGAAVIGQNAASSATSQYRSATGNLTVSNTTQLSLAVLLGTNGTTVATGGTFSLKPKFSVRKLS